MIMVLMVSSLFLFGCGKNENNDSNKNNITYTNKFECIREDKLTKDQIYYATKEEPLNGEKGEGKIISVRTGLIKSLKCNFESIDISELFDKIGNVPSFNGVDKRDVSFVELYNKNFIFELLIEEVKRLKLMEVKDVLVILKKMLFLSFNYRTSLVIIHPYYLDIVSLIFFHSILSGD